MNRVIYCPSDELIDIASSVSKLNHLPILVGDNDYTKELKFNRDIVSVISIPEYKGCICLENVKLGFHQDIRYRNEFTVIKNNIKLFINEKEVKSSYEETHSAKFVYLCTKSGSYQCKIFINDEIEEEFTFVVD